MKLLLKFSAIAIFIILQASCAKKGCTDSYSSNYSSSANSSDGSCLYPAIFYFDYAGPTASVTVKGQTGTITATSTGGAPACGTSGFANFSFPAGSYGYTGSSASTTWSGTLTITADVCNPVLLAQGTGDVTFWTANVNYLPITVTIPAQGSLGAALSYQITGALGGAPNCNVSSASANFTLPSGAYSWSAITSPQSAVQGTWSSVTSGLLTITGDQCNSSQQLN